MDIWLVRHGETDWNQAGRVQGWTDIPLNTLGKVQATRLSEHLRNVPFTHIYSSDLARAKDTATAVANQRNLSIVTTEVLREQCFGDAEGLPREEKLRRFPNGCPNGETNEQVQTRIVSFLESLTKTHTEGTILVATHGGVIRSALTWLKQPATFIQNTSITRLRSEQGKFRVLSTNETPHLADNNPLNASNIS